MAFILNNFSVLAGQGKRDESFQLFAYVTKDLEATLLSLNYFAELAGKISQNDIIQVEIIDPIDGNKYIIIRIDYASNRGEVGVEVLGGYVPYVGANKDVDLGEFDLTAKNLHTEVLNADTVNATDIITETIDATSGEFDSITFNPDATVTCAEGKVWWNGDEYTLNVCTGLGATIQVGQETLVLFYNGTGSQINNGSILHPTGGAMSGSTVVPAVELADASKYEKCQGTLWVATSDILDGELGFGTRFGKVRDLNTTAYPAGSQLWLSDINPGMFTNVQPKFPSYVISMGGSLNSEAVNGEVFVSITTRVEDTFSNGWDGAIRETFDFRVSSDGAVITGVLSNPNLTHDDLTCVYSTGLYTFDAPLNGSIVLTAGTDTNPQSNYVYIPESTKVLTISLTEFPDDIEHCKVAILELRSATVTQTDDAFVNQNWNDHVKKDNDNGHILHIAERMRQEPARWDSGVLGSSLVENVPSDVYVANTAGKVYQLHKQTFPALDTSLGDEAHIVNDFTTPYKELSNLNSQTLDANGDDLSNRSFSFVTWGIQNKTGEKSHTMVNVPIGSYAKNSPDSAVADAFNYSVYDIPRNFASVGFLIARFTYVLEANGTTWSLYDTQDLRGFQPSNAAGGSSGLGGVSEFTALTDTPSSYTGQSGKYVAVASGETALEFVDAPSGGGGASVFVDGGLISNNATTPDSVIDVAELFDTLSSDRTQTLAVSGASLDITSAGEFAGGVVPPSVKDQFPAMTSNTAPSGENAYATSQNSADWQPFEAFDKVQNSTNSWITTNGTTTGTLLRDMSSLFEIDSIAIGARTSGGSGIPKDFTIVYTTDDMSGYTPGIDATITGINYTTVLTVVGNVQTTTELKEFQLDSIIPANATAWGIVVTAVTLSGGGNYITIARLEGYNSMSTELGVHAWADYNSGTQRFILDDATGSNIAGAKRRVGSFITYSSGDIKAFTTVYTAGGYELRYNQDILDSINTASSTTYIEYPLSVPTGIELTVENILDVNRSSTRWAYFGALINLPSATVTNNNCNLRTSTGTTWNNSTRYTTINDAKVYIKSNDSVAWSLYLNTSAYTDNRGI